MFYGLEAIGCRFFFWVIFFSSAVTGILPLFPFFLALVFVFSLLLFCVEWLDLLCAGRRSWHCASQGHRSWYCASQGQFQASLPSCPSYLGLRRIRAQQSSFLPRTQGVSFNSTSIPLPLCCVTLGVSASSALPSLLSASCGFEAVSSWTLCCCLPLRLCAAAFIFTWQPRCTLNTRLKLQCPHADTWLPCSLELQRHAQ